MGEIVGALGGDGGGLLWFSVMFYNDNNEGPPPCLLIYRLHNTTSQAPLDTVAMVTVIIVLVWVSLNHPEGTPMNTHTLLCYIMWWYALSLPVYWYSDTPGTLLPVPPI